MDGAGLPYDQQHSEFVTTKYGTSRAEILHVFVSVALTPLLVSLLLPWIVPSSFTKLFKGNPRTEVLVRALIEYPLVLTLPLFIITIFTTHEADDAPWIPAVLVTLVSFCIGVIVVNQSLTRPPWSSLKEEWRKVLQRPLTWDGTGFSLEQLETGITENSKTTTTGLGSAKIPFITNFRGLVMWVTLLSILAVDFTIFPRRFAKTKTIGFSLMDAGTGCFVFSNGLISPEAKRLQSDLGKSLRGSIPLVALGIVRLISVRGTDYHEVVEEYGVHWNFFFTLAAVKILNSFLFTFVRPTSSLKCGFIISLAYEFLLFTLNLQDGYILNPGVDRGSSFLAANREGIFSVFGYWTIYLGSVYVGQIIYAGQNRVLIKDWILYGAQSGVQVILLWIVSSLAHANLNPCSRRVGNLSYSLWSLTLNYTLLWIELCLCLGQVILQHWGLLHGPLIFYELQKKSRREREGQGFGQHLPQEPIIQEESEDEEMRESEEETEDALAHLETQVDTVIQKIKEKEGSTTPSERLVLDDYVKYLEGELKVLGGKVGSHARRNKKKSANVGQGQQRTPELVSLPDLSRPPVTLEAICYNGLILFILANLLTGCINLAMFTKFASRMCSLFTLWIYATFLGCFSMGLYWFKIQIKFW